MWRNQYKYRFYSFQQMSQPTKAPKCELSTTSGWRGFPLHVTPAGVGHTPFRFRVAIVAPKRLLLKNETLFCSVFHISKGSKLFLQSAVSVSALWKDELKGASWSFKHRLWSSGATVRTWASDMCWLFGLTLLIWGTEVTGVSLKRKYHSQLECMAQSWLELWL